MVLVKYLDIVYKKLQQLQDKRNRQESDKDSADSKQFGCGSPSKKRQAMSKNAADMYTWTKAAAADRILISNIPDTSNGMIVNRSFVMRPR